MRNLYIGTVHKSLQMVGKTQTYANSLSEVKDFFERELNTKLNEVFIDEFQGGFISEDLKYIVDLEVKAA